MKKTFFLLCALLLVLGHEWLRGRPPKTMETAPAPLEGELR